MKIPIRQWLFDIKSFDDKHQHILSLASLATGITGHVVGKVYEHISTRTKKPDLEDGQTTTVRPKIIDFIDKIKKRSIQVADETDFHSLEDTNCGCSGKISIADGIAEHVADKGIKEEKKSSTDLELEEDASLKNKSSKVTKVQS